MTGLNEIQFPTTFEKFWLDIRHLAEQNPELKTIAQGKPNWFKIDKDAILVRTKKSSPIFHPISKEEFQKVYEFLKKPKIKEVTREFLLKSLKIYRSSAVCTLLSNLEYVEASKNPITIKVRK